MSLAWKPLRTVAESTNHDWQIDLDPASPASPLVFRANDGKCWEALKVEPGSKHRQRAEEIYVREKDLIAKFEQGPQDEFSFQINWRLLECAFTGEAGVEVWFSIQTNLLDSHPSLQLFSQCHGAWTPYSDQQLIKGDEVEFGAEGEKSIAAQTMQGHALNGLWLIDRRDQGHVTWTRGGSDHLRQAQLFGAFLEKGVIRRARMQFWVSAQPFTASRVRELYLDLARQDLPLTT